MKVALINEYVVAKVVDLSEEEIQTLQYKYQLIIDVSEFLVSPEPGWTFDGLNFFDANGVLGGVASRKITKLAFRNRFTFNEKVALRTALNQSTSLQAWYDDFMVSTYIDLARPDTIAGMAFLVQAQLLTSERAETILNTEIAENEKYRG
jgi:hypothetical protein